MTNLSMTKTSVFVQKENREEGNKDTVQNI